jgi:anti-anti-sigma factor
VPGNDAAVSTASPPFELEVHEDGTRIELVLSGDLDALGVPDLQVQAAYALRRHPGADVVLDLTRLTFIDSMGMAVIVRMLRRAESRGGSLRILCSPGPVLRALQLIRLDRQCEIIEIDAADAALQRE